VCIPPFFIERLSSFPSSDKTFMVRSFLPQRQYSRLHWKLKNKYNREGLNVEILHLSMNRLTTLKVVASSSKNVTFGMK
jgi:hypothetical protein